MKVTANMPGAFITAQDNYEAHTEKSARTHARTAFIRDEHGYAEPAVGIFTGKKYLSILTIADAERLTEEIQAAIRQHPGQD